MRCPKCGGWVYRDLAGERSCLQCGWTEPDGEPLPYIRVTGTTAQAWNGRRRDADRTPVLEPKQRRRKRG
jgi:hypothetical protein